VPKWLAKTVAATKPAQIVLSRAVPQRGSGKTQLPRFVARCVRPLPALPPVGPVGALRTGEMAGRRRVEAGGAVLVELEDGDDADAGS
jgi:hypothetical protein